MYVIKNSGCYQRKDGSSRIGSCFGLAIKDALECYKIDASYVCDRTIRFMDDVFGPNGWFDAFILQQKASKGDTKALQFMNWLNADFPSMGIRLNIILPTSQKRTFGATDLGLDILDIYVRHDGYHFEALFFDNFSSLFF